MTPDRTLLEKKDRASLVAIAKALGARASSRLRKDEIIDMILQLNGISPEESGKTAETDKAETGSSNEEAANSKTASKQSADEPASKDKTGDESRTAAKASSSAAKTQDKKADSASNEQKAAGNETTKAVASKSTETKEPPSEGEEDPRRRRRRRGRDRVEMQWEGDAVEVDGYLDLRSDGYGFLRVDGGQPSRHDAYVAVKMVRDFSLRPGDRVLGTSRPAARNEKNPALLSIESVNGRDPETARERENFEDLVPVYADERFELQEKGTKPAAVKTPKAGEQIQVEAATLSAITPFGKGSRCLIGCADYKTNFEMSKFLAQRIEANHPDVQMIVMLLDARPEDVTDLKRSVQNAEVIASCFDRPQDEHIATAELVSDRARRLVECGDDVVIILDGITQLAKAQTQSGRYTGRAISGVLDAGAMYPVKKFLASARNIQDGGSLTILATIAVETGAKIDELIYQELSGCAEVELKVKQPANTLDGVPVLAVEECRSDNRVMLDDDKTQADFKKLVKFLS